MLNTSAPYYLGPDTAPLLAAARARLEQQSDPAATANRAGAANPDHQMYGIFGPQYAANLAAPTDSASEHIFNRATLRNETHREQQAYSDALQQAQQGALDLADRQGYYGLLSTEMNTGPHPVLSGTRDVRRDPSTGLYGVFRNAPVANLDDEMRGDEVLAETRMHNAGADKTLYDMGIRTPVSVVARHQQSAGQKEPDQYQNFDESGYAPPDENSRDRIPIEWYDAESRRTAAEADMYRAQNPPEREYDQYQYLPGQDQPTLVQRRAAGSPMPANPNAQGQAPQPPAHTTQPSDAQSRLMGAMQQRGFRTGMQGDIMVVVDPQSGQRAMYDPSGQRIRQGRGGGSPASSPQSSAGHVNAGWFVTDRPAHGTRRRRDGSPRDHLGYDMHSRDGSPLRVPFDVTVRRPRSGGISGNRVDLAFDDGAVWWPMHLPNFPRTGRYSAGQLALMPGLTGTSGRGAPHIHMQPGNDIARRNGPRHYFGVG